jgi:hypothetical protein
MAAAAHNPNGVLLNSWKEIANYLGRGVRTVQRWEHDLGLPVRRPWGRSRSTVMAISDELDAWLRTAPTHELPQPSEGMTLVSEPEEKIVELRRAVIDAHQLRKRAEQLCMEHGSALTVLANNISQMETLLRKGRTIQMPLQPLAH